jgi:hypothetical protein
MKISAQLIKCELSRLTTTAGFSLALLFIVLSTLYLVPSVESKYCILKANQQIGYPNDIWTGVTVSISAVLIIATVTFFFLDGSYKQDSSAALFDLMRSTVISSEEFLITRTVTYFCLTIVFLFILVTATLIPKVKLIWVGIFDVSSFVGVILYISVPGLLFFSIVMAILEHFVAQRVWRIAIYVMLVNLLLITSYEPLSQFIDFFGYFEIKNIVAQALALESGSYVPVSLSFGVSPIGISNKYFFLNSFHPSLFFIKRCISLVGITACLVGLAKWRFKKFSLPNSVHSDNIKSKRITSATNLPDYYKKIEPSKIYFLSKFSILSLLGIFTIEIKQVLLFLKFKAIAGILLLLLVSGLLDLQLAFHFLPPVLFLLLLPLFTNYLIYQDELRISFLIVATPVSYYYSLVVRWLVICSLLVVLLLPLLWRAQFSGESLRLVGGIIAISFIVALASVLSIKKFKSTKLLEIIYIVASVIVIWLKP